MLRRGPAGHHRHVALADLLAEPVEAAVAHHRRAAPHRLAVDQVEGAALVVVPPPSPVGALRQLGGGRQLPLQGRRRRCRARRSATGRNERRRIFPLAVFGRSSSSLTSVGRLYAASRSRQKSDELLGGRGRSSLQARERDHGFASVGVLAADDRGLADGRVLVEHVLDVARPHLVAGGDDQVLHPVDEVDPAGLVDEADVAGVEDAAAQHVGGLVRPLPISADDAGPVDHQLADLARAQASPLAHRARRRGRRRAVGRSPGRPRSGSTGASSSSGTHDAGAADSDRP